VSCLQTILNIEDTRTHTLSSKNCDASETVEILLFTQSVTAVGNWNASDQHMADALIFSAVKV